MSIAGSKREVKDFSKQVGIFEGEVVCINPSVEEFKETLGIELKEDSKAAEYLGESKEGNVYLRLNVWLKNVKTDEIFQSPVSFFLEDKKRENKEGGKLQYVNSVGSTSWADDPNNLPDWFVGDAEKKLPIRKYRVANVGEEELYEFLRTWLGQLNLRDADTDLSIDWKKLMKGNVKELREQIGGEYCNTVGYLGTVVTREKDGEVKEYQGIYNKAFLPAYAIKNFRLVDYSDKDQIAKISAKKAKDQKPHEKFVLKVTGGTSGEHGCKDFYVLKDLIEYDPSMNIVASDKVIDATSSEY